MATAIGAAELRAEQTMRETWQEVPDLVHGKARPSARIGINLVHGGAPNLLNDHLMILGGAASSSA
jgi:hypothetical protein